MDALEFAKGHGTGNDFVLIPDPDGRLDLPGSLVAALCDRRFGIGADGVLRVVRAAAHPAAAGSGAEWFMDYRNADGSIVEMCGNGVRVLARYLWEARLVSGPVLPIATRGGIRVVHADPSGSITVEMGRAKRPASRVEAVVGVGERQWPAVAVNVPNPHAVVFVDQLNDAGALLEAPVLAPPSLFPNGANVEFVVSRGPQRIAMRVFERGVGETRSCGTGVCAAAWAAMRRDGVGKGLTYQVDVPGGELTVTERPDAELLLTGPAVLGVRGKVEL